MIVVHLVKFLRQPFSTKVKTVVSTLKKINRNYYTSKEPASFDFKTQVKNDVVIYSLENRNFFIGLYIFSFTQCLVWTDLGLFFFPSLDNPALNVKEDRFGGTILEIEREYSKALSVFSVFFGWAILLTTLFYSKRTVRKIILHKDGRFVTMVTYGLPGYNTFRIPLNNISSMEHRTKARKYIPIKMKDSYFYYLVDIAGEFSNPKLYDFTVGVKRGF